MRRDSKEAIAGLVMVLAMCAVVLTVVPAQAQLTVDTTTADQVRQWQSEGKRFWFIDVRQHHAHDQNHAEGSICIPAFALLDKKLPKDGLIVLYCDSIGELASRKACRKMSEAGYGQASILDGGLAGWRDVDLPVVAPRGVLEVPLVRSVTPRDLASAIEAGLAVDVIELREEGQPAVSTIPGAQVVRVAGGKDGKGGYTWKRPVSSMHGKFEVVERVATRVADDRYIVVVGSGKGDGKRIAEMLRRRGYKRVRYLYGGVTGWEARIQEN